MLKPIYFSTCALVALSSVNAATIAYWRFGDDAGAGFLGDSSGNENSLSVDNGTATQTAIPVSGPGSTFPNPVPQNSFANAQMADKNGVLVGDANDILGGVTSMTMESLFNLDANSASSTQYIFSHWLYTGSSQRSFAMGIDESDGRVTGTANQLFLLLSGNGSSSVTLQTGFTVTQATDYFIAWSYDGTTDTDDVTVYFQDLTNSGSLQSVTLSSTYTTLHESSSNEFTLGSLINNISATNSFIDEVRVSDQVLSQGELLISVPEPGHYAMLAGLSALGLLLLRRRR